MKLEKKKGLSIGSDHLVSWWVKGGGGVMGGGEGGWGRSESISKIFARKTICSLLCNEQLCDKVFTKNV